MPKDKRTKSFSYSANRQRQNENSNVSDQQVFSFPRYMREDISNHPSDPILIRDESDSDVLEPILEMVKQVGEVEQDLQTKILQYYYHSVVLDVNHQKMLKGFKY